MTRDGTAEPVSRDQIILRREQGQGNINFPFLAHHTYVQDWQPYPVDPYSAICDDHTYIHTIHTYNTYIHGGMYVIVCIHGYTYSKSIYLKPPHAIGPVPSLSGHAMAYRWRSLPRVRRHSRANEPQGSSKRVLPWQVTMDQSIFASLSHTPTNGMKWAAC